MATKNGKNLPLVLTLQSKYSCFVKTGGTFFQILWPSHNALTLRKAFNSFIEPNDKNIDFSLKLMLYIFHVKKLRLINPIKTMLGYKAK